MARLILLLSAVLAQLIFTGCNGGSTNLASRHLQTMTATFNEMTSVLRPVNNEASARNAVKMLDEYVTVLEKSSAEYQRAAQEMDASDKQLSEYIRQSDAFFVEYNRVRNDSVVSRPLKETFARIEALREQLAE